MFSSWTEQVVVGLNFC